MPYVTNQLMTDQLVMEVHCWRCTACYVWKRLEMVFKLGSTLKTRNDLWMLENYGHTLPIIKKKHCENWRRPPMTSYSDLNTRNKKGVKNRMETIIIIISLLLHIGEGWFQPARVLTYLTFQEYTLEKKTLYIKIKNGNSSIKSTRQMKARVNTIQRKKKS